MRTQSSLSFHQWLLYPLRLIAVLVRKCLFLKQEKDKKVRVAVLRLQGVIGKDSGFKPALNLENLESAITKAFETKKIVAVALIINSPGGSPVQSELIYRRIRALSDETKIPVYSFAEDCAASGGYWLACAGEEIYVMGSSLVGSIGVIASGFGFVDAIKKIGIERRIYKQGENKSLLDPFLEERPEEVAVITRAQAAIHEQFKQLVRSRRQGKIKPADESVLFSGEFWCGTQAVANGLADGLGDMRTVMEQKFTSPLYPIFVNKPTSWIKRKLGISLHGLAHSLLTAIEERQLWGRLGL